MPKIHTRELDAFVGALDDVSGNFQHPDFATRFIPFDIEFDTKVDDVSLSPYSEEYYQQQIALYEEIAGRRLDQSDGELHPDDIEHLIDAPNPIGGIDIRQMVEHVRGVSMMVSIAGFSGRPNVLDMGAGHGVASEIMAFMACNVQAVDIDPVLGELSIQRAKARGLSIDRKILNFDDISSIENGKFDGAFFSQSLHHCLKPWVLIERLKKKIKPEEGVIGFVGEPINGHWWKSWGLRLDHESIYVARKHGWFESGWTLEFITDCFERNGFTLDMFSGGVAGGHIGIATMSDRKRQEVLAQAEMSGASHIKSVASPNPGEDLYIDSARYMTLIGDKVSFHGRPAFGQQEDRCGVLLYGPYVSIPAGKYDFSALVHRAPAGLLRFDIVSDLGENILFEANVEGSATDDLLLITGELVLAEGVGQVELRAAVDSGIGWKISFPTLRRRK